MKNFLKRSFVIACLLFSVSAFADKIVISGEPIVVEKKGDVYMVPTTVTTSDHYYFTVGDKQEVCYEKAQPALAAVDLGVAQFNIGNSNVQLNCYTYSPDYFEVK